MIDPRPINPYGTIPDPADPNTAADPPALPAWPRNWLTPANAYAAPSSADLIDPGNAFMANGFAIPAAILAANWPKPPLTIVGFSHEPYTSDPAAGAIDYGHAFDASGPVLPDPSQAIAPLTPGFRVVAIGHDSKPQPIGDGPTPQPIGGDPAPQPIGSSTPAGDVKPPLLAPDAIPTSGYPWAMGSLFGTGELMRQAGEEAQRRAAQTAASQTSVQAPQDGTFDPPSRAAIGAPWQLGSLFGPGRNLGTVASAPAPAAPLALGAATAVNSGQIAPSFFGSTGWSGGVSHAPMGSLFGMGTVPMGPAAGLSNYATPSWQPPPGSRRTLVAGKFDGPGGPEEQQQAKESHAFGQNTFHSAVQEGHGFDPGAGPQNARPSARATPGSSGAKSTAVSIPGNNAPSLGTIGAPSGTAVSGSPVTAKTSPTPNSAVPSVGFAQARGRPSTQTPPSSGLGNMASILTAAARRAQAKVGRGRGPVHGSKMHAAFKAEIDALNLKDVSTEISYRNGKRIRYGELGSVRLDVVDGPLHMPTAIYDLKTGMSPLTLFRIRQIQAHLPPGLTIPVFKVTP